MPDIPFITDVSPIPQFHQITAVLVIGTIPQLRITDLHFDWSIVKTMNAEPDTATINIYNMDPVSRELIVAKFSEALALSTPSPIATAIAGVGGVEVDPFVPQIDALTLFLGWQGRSELLFTGGFIGIRPEIYATVDTITQIVASDAGLNMRELPPPGGDVAAVAASTVFANHAGILGLKVAPAALAKVLERAAEVPLPTWQFSDITDSRIVLNDLMASLGLKWGVANGAVVIYDGGIRDDLLPVQLGTGSGLLSWTRTDNGAYTVQALARPDVLPGGRLILTDNLGLVIGLGPLRVSSVTFTGTNDGPSLMTIDARKLDLIGLVGPFGVFV